MEPTGRMRLSLRRFTFRPDQTRPEGWGRGSHHACPASDWGCDASVDLEDFITARWDDSPGYGKVMMQVPLRRRPGKRDPRWPPDCAKCGEPFPRGAQWQVNQVQEFRRSDTGEIVYSRGHSDAAVAGALYDVWWGRYLGKDGRENVGDDGISLGAICPNGALWQVDHEASGGGRWTRTGDPRRPETLTVSPSIMAGDYHGFLQGGRFTNSI